MNDQSASALRRKVIWAAGVGAAVAGMGLALWRFQPKAVVQARRHPVWSEQFETPSGQKLSMSAFQGKPLLLNFWATWCPPCVDELPMMDVFWRENRANGHQVLALAIDQPSAVRRFLERHPLGFPVGMAGLTGTTLAKSLGNAAGAVPFTVFFKADGSIWREKMGQLTQADLMAWRAVSV